MSTVQRRTLNYSFANGTSDREACSKRWLAILVRMNTERSCASLLSKVQIENYVPVQVEYHQWSDRRKKVERVVIPMVIFVYVNAEQEKSLYTYSFVHKILSYPGQKSPAVIPDEQITRLRFMLRYADSPVSVNDFPSAEFYYQIVAATSDKEYCYFVYQEDGQVYLEIPYSGVYKGLHNSGSDSLMEIIPDLIENHPVN